MVSECLQLKSSSEGEATKDCNTLETLPAASQVALWREACEDALSEASFPSVQGWIIASVKEEEPGWKSALVTHTPHISHPT